METSLRLEKIISLIDKSVIADIGCDHALVCLGAIAKHKANKAYACDLRPGPLQQAALNIQSYGFQEQIFPRLQDGIQGLPEDVEEIIIAGMGGKLIIEILSQGLPDHVTTLLLAPHKDVKALRTYLLHQGFLLQEWMVHDRHFYPILKATRALQPPQELDEESLWWGYNVQVNQDYLDFLFNRKQALENLLQTLNPNTPAYQAFQNELALLQNRLNQVS